MAARSVRKGGPVVTPSGLKVATPPRQEPPTTFQEVVGGCQVTDLFRVLGKSYMLDIIYVITSQDDGAPMRFVEIQQHLRMSPNTLSDRLRELVEVGLLSRTAYAEIPPRVDYAPTDKARDLQAVFVHLADWTTRHDLQPAATGPEADGAMVGASES